MEIISLLQSLQFPMPDIEQNELKQKIGQQINYLITNDFNRLVQLLYTVDVDEQKLKQLLLQQPEQDAATVISGLIFSRYEEKTRSRQYFKTDSVIDADERW